MHSDVAVTVPRPFQRHTPQRTCVGCRGRDEQSRLLRVVGVSSAQHDGEVPGAAVVLTPDPKRRMDGRGAYVHRGQACVEQALRRRAFGRALRIDGTLSSDHLVVWMEHHRTGSTRA